LKEKSNLASIFKRLKYRLGLKTESLHGIQKGIQLKHNSELLILDFFGNASMQRTLRTITIVDLVAQCLHSVSGILTRPNVRHTM
jgi:hypothetical protein